MPTTRRCAFLSIQSLEGFVCDDDLAVEPFARLGWQVESAPWRGEEVNWDAYSAVLIRSPWDYQDDADAFLALLERIESSSARLANPLSLVRWNMNKSYLRELEQAGVAVVPTAWPTDTGEETIRDLFGTLEVAEIVLKPIVGANADHTYRVRQEDLSALLPRLQEAYGSQPYLAQPFVESVVEEGEYSVVFLGGEYSHALLKTAAPNDFRVQEEHGGGIEPIQPEPELLERARQAHAVVDPAPLYARVDLVRNRQGGFDLMELELIEPCLYLRMDPQSPRRLARVFDRWMSGPG